MANELVTPAFDYNLVDKDTKSKLIWFEGELGRSRKRAADEAVRHGEIFHGVQQLLANHSNGVFVAWLDSVGVSTSSAYRAIDIHLEFPGFPNWENLEVSAAYQLAKNPKAKKKALALVNKGVKVTHAMAKKLIEDTNSKTRGDGASGGKQKPDSSSLPPTSCNPETEQPPPDDCPFEEDYGQCPVCAGDKWTATEDGMVCKKCGHTHGEPAGDPDEDRIKTQRQKTVKTAEALMRAFDDLHCMLGKKSQHSDAIAHCKLLLGLAREWK